MIVVRRFRDLPEAEIASAALWSAEVENALRDAETIGLLWTYSNGLGGIRLEVPDGDAEDADALLSAAGAEEPSAGDAAGAEEGEAGETCAACGSAEVLIDSGARPTLALWLLLFPMAVALASRPILALVYVVVVVGFPLSLWRTRARCRACGATRVVPFGMPAGVAFALAISAAGTVLALIAVLGLAVFLGQLLQKIR